MQSAKQASQSGEKTDNGSNIRAFLTVLISELRSLHRLRLPPDSSPWSVTSTRSYLRNFFPVGSSSNPPSDLPSPAALCDPQCRLIRSARTHPPPPPPPVSTPLLAWNPLTAAFTPPQLPLPPPVARRRRAVAGIALGSGADSDPEEF